MRNRVTRILSFTGWSLLAIVGGWAFGASFGGLPSHVLLGGAYGLALLGLVLVAAGQSLEGRDTRITRDVYKFRDALRDLGKAARDLTRRA